MRTVKDAVHEFDNQHMGDYAISSLWRLEGQWNQVAITLVSQYSNYNANSSSNNFVSTVKQFIGGHDGLTDQYSTNDDYWAIDNKDFHHIIGSNFDGDSRYVGYIADVIFSNHAIETVNMYGTDISASGCRSCGTHCPSSLDYLECMTNCPEGDSQCFIDCGDKPGNNPYCPTDCPDTQYMDDNFTC